MESGFRIKKQQQNKVKETTDLINITIFREFLVKCFDKIKTKPADNIPFMCELFTKGNISFALFVL